MGRKKPKATLHRTEASPSHHRFVWSEQGFDRMHGLGSQIQHRFYTNTQSTHSELHQTINGHVVTCSSQAHCSEFLC